MSFRENWGVDEEVGLGDIGLCSRWRVSDKRGMAEAALWVEGEGGGGGVTERRLTSTPRKAKGAQEARTYELHHH